jgi:N-acyl-D-aspartate/D-glutamate deacylase
MRADGLDVKPQVAARPIGVLLGLEATANPFLFTPAFDEIAREPLAARVAALRDPERKRRILEEHAAMVGGLPDGLFKSIVSGWDVLFALSDPVDYELDAKDSVGAQARGSGSDPASLVYDVLLERDGTQLLYLPLFNFAHGNFDDLYEMITNEFSLFGLSDAGAHCGAICDGSMPTSAMVVWARDRRGGEKIPLEAIVHQQTQRTAAHVGWLDRGVLAPGYVGDVNVIDLEALACHAPRVIHDLPAGGRRLMQTASGYRATVKSGTVTFEDGQHTGELPGALVRGRRARP